MSALMKYCEGFLGMDSLLHTLPRTHGPYGGSPLYSAHFLHESPGNVSLPNIGNPIT